MIVKQFSSFFLLRIFSTFLKQAKLLIMHSLLIHFTVELFYIRRSDDTRKILLLHKNFVLINYFVLDSFLIIHMLLK